MSNGAINVGRVNQNIEGYENIRIDRCSPLGNPFKMMDQSEEERNRVCDEYDMYMHDKMLDKNSTFYREMLRIYKLLKNGINVNLQCWCAPKRCHGETIKTLLQIALKK